MKRSHGKPKSACHNAPLRVVQNGEWTEQYCTEEGCNQPVHPDGQLYRYLPTDPARASGVQRIETSNPDTRP